MNVHGRKHIWASEHSKTMLSLSADVTHYCIEMEIASGLLTQTPHVLYIMHYMLYLHTCRWAYAEMK